MRKLISKIAVRSRFRKHLGNIEELAASIAEVGLLHPVVVDKNGNLIAGRRRLEAAKQLGWKAIEVHEVDLKDLRQGEFHENVVRQDFLPSEMVAIKRAFEPTEREAAKERMSLAGKGGKVSHPSRAFEKMARHAGASYKTIQKAEEVVAAAEAEPEKFAPLVEEMDRTRRVDGVHRKLKVARQAKKLSEKPLPSPQGPFDVIVVDPPWQYNLRAQDPSHKGPSDYASMSIEEIKALPVGTLAGDSCVLWLWTTNAHMRQAFEVLDAWGFKHKTILTWVKPRIGAGVWLRGATEHCLMAVKGRPTVTLKSQSTALAAPTTGHSSKPVEFYTLVESLCPGSKLEMFARGERDGWTVWGLEAKTTT